MLLPIVQCTKCDEERSSFNPLTSAKPVCAVCGWDHARKVDTVEETPHRD